MTNTRYSIESCYVSQIASVWQASSFLTQDKIAEYCQDASRCIDPKYRQVLILTTMERFPRFSFDASFTGRHLVPWMEIPNNPDDFWCAFNESVNKYRKELLEWNPPLVSEVEKRVNFIAKNLWSEVNYFLGDDLSDGEYIRGERAVDSTLEKAVQTAIDTYEEELRQGIYDAFWTACF